MERLEATVAVVAAQRRDELLARASNGGDDDLPLEDRPNRAEVAPGCLLKFGDDVSAYGQTYRYLCPGRGIGWAYGLTLEVSGFTLGSFEATAVEDRAPADPNETPMPIFQEGPA